MIPPLSYSLEAIWEGLLSRNPEHILKILKSLDPASQVSVLDHLRRMVNEEGWLPVQQQSAHIALSVIQSLDHNNPPPTQK